LRNAYADSDIGISTLSEAAMANLAGESNDGALKLDVDRPVMLQFRGSVVTSDAGLLAYLELDDSPGLTLTALPMREPAATAAMHWSVCCGTRCSVAWPDTRM
jgi:hypothetical protein